jgi:hypothetical protein
VRNLRTVHSNEPDIVGGATWSGRPAPISQRGSSEVMSRHTHFEYEELNWQPYRSFTAKGDGPADLRWPEYTLEPDRRVSERRESYRATFSRSRQRPTHVLRTPPAFPLAVSPPARRGWDPGLSAIPGSHIYLGHDALMFRHMPLVRTATRTEPVRQFRSQLHAAILGMSVWISTARLSAYER